MPALTPNEEFEEQSRDREKCGGTNAARNGGPHLLMGREAVAQIAVEQLLPEVHVLQPDRLIEAVVVFDDFEFSGVSPSAQYRGDWVTRDYVNKLRTLWSPPAAIATSAQTSRPAM